MHQLLSNCKVKINNMTDYVFNSSGIEGVYTDDYTFVGTELLIICIGLSGLSCLKQIRIL